MAGAAIGIGRFVNIAHRGASGHAPENTVTACRHALAMGADFIEMDVRRTSDGWIVAFHDDNLERTTDGQGAFAGHSLADLRTLDAGAWFNRACPERADPAHTGAPIATLEELITAVGDTAGLYIEAKAPADQPGIERELVDRLAAHGLIPSDRVVLQAFGTASLHAYRAHAPDTLRVQLLEYAVAEGGRLHELDGVAPPPGEIGPQDFARIAEYAHGIGPGYMAGGREIIDRAFVENAHAAGLFVHAWTVDDAEAMHRLIDLGVDGIFTNFPDRLAAIRPRGS